MAENIEDIRRPAAPAAPEAVNQEPAQEEETVDEIRGPRRKKKEPEKKEKKMAGPIFWMILLAAIVIDVVELLADLSVVFSIATMITGPVFSFVLFTYYFLIGVSVTGKKAVAKITTWIITSIVSFIPFLNWLPQATVSLVVTRIFENSELAQAATTVVSVRKAGRELAKKTLEEAREEAV